MHLAVHVEEEAEEGEKVKEKNHPFKMSLFERLFVKDRFWGYMGFQEIFTR